MSDDHTAGALLVGAGNIGALYDIDAGPKTVPLTHLSALAGSPQVEWIDVVEADPTRIQRLEANRKVRRCVQSLTQLTTDSRNYKIACVATPSDKYSADTRHVVPRVKGVPMTIKICLKPGGKIHWIVWGRYSDVAQITRAVACRNVHATAECDGEMRVVTADTGSLVESFPGRLRGAGMLVTKSDMLIDEIADGLDASPSGG